MKDRWFALYEAKLNELEAEGLSYEEATDLATEYAVETQRAMAEDYADMRRSQRKEEGF